MVKNFINYSLGNNLLRKHSGVFCIIALAIGIGLYPALSGRFAFHNDWLFLAPLPWDFPWWAPHFIETQHLFNIGRPAGALLINLQAFFVTSLDAMAVSRIVSALLVIFSAVVMYLFLHRQNVSRFLAVGFAVVIALLPPFQLYVVWSTNLVSGSLVIALVSAGYLWLEYVWQEHPKNLPKQNIMMITAVFIFILMMIYPPTALYGLVFTGARLILSSALRRMVWELALRDMAIYATAMIFYFLYTKTLASYAPVVPLSVGSNPLYSYGTGLAVDLQAKLSYLAEVLYTVLSLSLGVLSLGEPRTWNDPSWYGLSLISPMASVYMIVAGAIGWGTVLYTRPQHVHILHVLPTIIITGTLLFGIFIMSLAPSLLAHANILGIRIFAVPEAIWLVILLSPLAYLYRRREMAANCLLAGVILLQVILSYHNLDRTVRHCEWEYSFFKQALSQKGDYKLILLVMRPRSSQMINPPLPLEFGALSLGGTQAAGLLKAAVLDAGGRYKIMGSGYKDTIGMFNTGDGYSYELIWTEEGYSYVLQYHKKAFKYLAAISFNNYSIPIDFAGGGDDPIDYHKLFLLSSVPDVLVIDVNQEESK